MRKPSFQELTEMAFAAFFLRMLFSPSFDLFAICVLVLLAALLAGGKVLQFVADRAQLSDVGEEIKTLQNKVASLSVAVGLGHRK